MRPVWRAKLYARNIVAAFEANRERANPYELTRKIGDVIGSDTHTDGAIGARMKQPQAAISAFLG